MAHQLIYPSMHTENVLSGRFRVHAVIGDSMEPALRGGRDCALVSPVTSYSGEGIYLIETGLGVDLFRVTSTFDGAGGLCLSKENQRYRSQSISREQFNETVLGIVVADIKPRDERFLGEMVQ
ncbi:hypothetical protein [Sinorhizobium meliloti]|uniref:hypothetical protein n=1 Tax=Rhizobium meliloti TaxID=382 RepID=UPI001F2F4F54|nr:hypothetical protein [Sinorhizobium meliloti]